MNLSLCNFMDFTTRSTFSNALYSAVDTPVGGYHATGHGRGAPTPVSGAAPGSAA